LEFPRLNRLGAISRKTENRISQRVCPEMSEGPVRVGLENKAEDDRKDLKLVIRIVAKDASGEVRLGREHGDGPGGPG
jgi:hypothetical protein